jgi:two-component system sensor kinase FixL
LLNGELTTYQMDKRYLRKDGFPLWTLTTVAAFGDEGARPGYLVVQVLDTTGQRLARQALEASETRYRHVIESATDGIVVINRDGEIVSANSQACELFGYPVGELTGLPVLRIIPGRFRKAHADGMERLRRTGLPKLAGQLLELWGQRRDESEFPIEMTVAAWRESDGELFSTAIIRDVTERKRAEKERFELLESNRDLEEFALIASHDLQEPLRKIAFYTERFTLQNKEQLQPGTWDNVEKVLDATYRMQNLISDLLGYARINRRRSFAPVDLNQVLAEVVSDLDILIREAKADVRVGKLPVVEADSTQMRQLFGNLVENSLKYRRAGVSPIVSVYATVIHGTTDPGEGPVAEIRVEDNGIGFDEKYLDRIFRVFQRLHGRGQYHGTGIGLATCRRIVERHHGTITAESTPGAGAEFIVTLPVRQADTEEKNEVNQEPAYDY